MTYSVHEAKVRFSKLLDIVEEGEEVVMIRLGQPVLRLVAAPKKNKRRLGTMVGEISWQEAWDKPMTGQELDEFLLRKG